MNFKFTFKSAKKAYVIPVDGETRGTIPQWIKGSLYKNGPAKYEVGSDKYNHIFDGLAMLQRFYINDGKVTFNSQYIQSKAYLRNMAANRIVVSEFGTAAYPDPCGSIFNRFSVMFDKEFTDNTSVCVYPVGDELFTATETNVIHRMDPTDLSTIGSVRLANILSINRATAHYHIDNDTGLVHLVGFINFPVPSYAMVTLPPIKKEESEKLQEKYDMEKLLTGAKIIGKIKARWALNPSYYHSFGLTENYYIFLECPLAMSILDLLKLKTAFTAMKWWPNEKTIIHIMNRKTGELLPNTYVTDPLFTFHHINAYEDQGHIVFDYCGYDNGDVIFDLYTETPESEKSFEFLCRPRRIVVPIQIDEKSKDNLVQLPGTTCTANIIEVANKRMVVYCKQEELTNGSTMELPTINYEAYNGKKYRFLYGVQGGHVKKVDTLTKETFQWVDDKNEGFACESVFVKNPDADDNNPDDEDYGVLLTPIIVRDVNIDTERYISLVFIDAKSMEELGRAEFPSVSVPFSLHGIFQNN